VKEAAEASAAVCFCARLVALPLPPCLGMDIYGRLAAVTAVIACGLSLLISTRLFSHSLPLPAAAFNILKYFFD
jgi:hypothetical protein